jgi:hypothetical protein
MTNVVTRRVLLVSPPVGRSQLGKTPMPPLGLDYVAGVLEEDGHDVAILDCVLEGIDERALERQVAASRPDIVGITGTTRTRYEQTIEMERHHLRFTWYCEVRVNTVDYDLLKRMHGLGCRFVSFGVESGSPRVIKPMPQEDHPAAGAEGPRLVQHSAAASRDEEAGRPMKPAALARHLPAIRGWDAAVEGGASPMAASSRAVSELAGMLR